MLREIASKADLDAVLSYCHFNPMISDLNEVLVPVTKPKQIGLINASPLHMGILSEDGPPPWHPAPEEVKQKGKEIVELCARRGASPSKVSLRVSLDNPNISSTLVGVKGRKQLRENLRALECTIPQDLLESIQQIVSSVKDRTWPSGRPENSDV
jgi:L-galactose dehydrogenase